MALKDSLQQLQQDKIVLLVDDASSQTTAFLIAPAEHFTAEQVAFLVNTGRGLVCAALTVTRAQELGLPPMSRRPSERAFSFTASVESRHGVTTGISCADRAETLRTLATTTDPKRDLVMPGHIFPVIARTGGVLVRNSAPEAAVDLMQLAELTPVAVFCQCLNELGELPSRTEIEAIEKDAGLAVVYISEVIHERLARESIIERIAEAQLPTAEGGDFRAVAFRSFIDDSEHLALVKGEIATQKTDGGSAFPKVERPVLVRVQAENLVGDLLGSAESATRQQIGGALRAIAAAGEGVFVYVRHPRQGLLAQQLDKIAAERPEFARKNAAPAHLQSSSIQENLPGLQRAPVLREYGVGAQILASLGIQKIRLLTNSDRDIGGLDAFGLTIIERVNFDLPERHEQQSAGV